MKIAIVGSCKSEYAEEWKLRDEARFAEACQWIGEDIVRNGHQMIVASDRPRTADCQATEGAIRALGNSEPAEPPIIVVQPDDVPPPFPSQSAAHPELFTTRNSPGNTFAVTHLFEVYLADVVIVVGGGKSSYQAGVSAAVAGRLIVPVGSFGGAGNRLINLFQRSRHQWASNLLDDSALGMLRHSWSDALGEHVSKFARIRTSPRVLVIHGRSSDRFVLKDFLQNKVGLTEPVVMVQQLTHNLTIPEKFETVARDVDGAIALVTPDDVGALSDPSLSIDGLEARARENVWLEVGWIWGKLGRERFLLLLRGKPNVPSDLRGIDPGSYNSSPEECAEVIRHFIASLRKSG